eukprot:CAMPEP_0178383870 /NCGR_PEP_ID=MMETSP0689_2-20121128/7223_1 /TAXON_ID=160604 /ORGANISM="Amphidinium massartii, Strain CS-259" /LENGTH=300 /DNA_ID=CAMNT_0020004101 /DNA_START=137 /DNA_END=1036 /DNA_ORIENTATION=-
MSDMQEIGEELYSIIVQAYPEMAGKLTGMLLELGEAECLACLGCQQKLAEMLDEAMRILDEGGQGASPELPPPVQPRAEMRVDPEDGRTRTLEDLHTVYKGIYSRREIEQYWLFCKPLNEPAEDLRSGGRGSPLLENTGGRTRALQPVLAPNLAASTAASSSAAKVEALPGLTAFLMELKLSTYAAAANAWVDEQGACSLDEVLENMEDFADGLKLKPLERKRLEKNGAAAVELATATAATLNAARTSQEAVTNRVDERSAPLDGEHPSRGSGIVNNVSKDGVSRISAKAAPKSSGPAGK